MTSIAEKKKQYENLEFAVAEASKLPFEESIFEVSCVSFALHDMIPSVAEKAIRELSRVTRD